jgi:hypothetical protein
MLDERFNSAKCRWLIMTKEGVCENCLEKWSNKHLKDGDRSTVRQSET